MADSRGNKVAMQRRPSGLPGRAMSVIPKKSMAPSAGGKASNRILINVGGIHYETYKSTLKNIPDSRLAWLTESTSQSNADFDPQSGEYFFDRHPGIFNMILNFYRTGKLHVPTDVCGPLFEEELAFWGLDERQIEPCCWTAYRTHREAQETLRELDGEGGSRFCDSAEEDEGAEEADLMAKRFGLEEVHSPRKSCWDRWRPRLWTLVDDPNSSKGAKAVAIMSVMFVLLSITTFCLETHIEFREPRNASEPLDWNWSTWEKNTKSQPTLALVVMDSVSTVYFTLEFVIRLILCPSKKGFFRGVLNWVDILSIVPFYVEKIVMLVEPSVIYSIYMQAFRAMRMIRIFRIFKLTRHFSGLKILWHSIKASAKELLLLILFLFISVLIFACLIYYAESVEQNPRNNFKNIPLGFWWAVVTMTTLGYGDMHPRTGLGYLVGGLCAVAGVLVLALPVPVIVNNFALYYSHAQAKLKLPKKQKRILIGAHDDLKADTTAPEETDSDLGEESVASRSPTPSEETRTYGDMTTRGCGVHGRIPEEEAGEGDRGCDTGRAGDQRAHSPNPSLASISSDRKTSDDSALGSLDSGNKAPLAEGAIPGRPSRKANMSVVYVDESATAGHQGEGSKSRDSPPLTSRWKRISRAVKKHKVATVGRSHGYDVRPSVRRTDSTQRRDGLTPLTNLYKPSPNTVTFAPDGYDSDVTGSETHIDVTDGATYDVTPVANGLPAQAYPSRIEDNNNLIRIGSASGDNTIAVEELRPGHVEATDLKMTGNSATNPHLQVTSRVHSQSAIHTRVDHSDVTPNRTSSSGGKLAVAGSPEMAPSVGDVSCTHVQRKDVVAIETVTVNGIGNPGFCLSENMTDIEA